MALATGYRVQDFDPAELIQGEQSSMSYSTHTFRTGKSVCMTLEDLAAYLVQAGVPFDGNSYLVEVEGDWATDEDGNILEDEDHAFGAHLIVPTRIVSVTTVDEGLTEYIDEACEALGLDF